MKRNFFLIALLIALQSLNLSYADFYTQYLDSDDPFWNDTLRQSSRRRGAPEPRWQAKIR